MSKPKFTLSIETEPGSGVFEEVTYLESNCSVGHRDTTPEWGKGVSPRRTCSVITKADIEACLHEDRNKIERFVPYIPDPSMLSYTAMRCFDAVREVYEEEQMRRIYSPGPALVQQWSPTISDRVKLNDLPKSLLFDKVFIYGQH